MPIHSFIEANSRRSSYMNLCQLQMLGPSARASSGFSAAGCARANRTLQQPQPAVLFIPPTTPKCMHSTAYPPHAGSGPAATEWLRVGTRGGGWSPDQPLTKCHESTGGFLAGGSHSRGMAGPGPRTPARPQLNPAAGPWPGSVSSRHGGGPLFDPLAP